MRLGANDHNSGWILLGDVARFIGATTMQPLHFTVDDPLPLFTYFERACRLVSRAQRGQAELSYEVALTVAESPIEALFAPFLIFQFYGERLERPARVATAKNIPEPASGQVIIIPQLVVDHYRLDFAVRAHLDGRTKLIAVECDGVDFHELNRDARRDAYLGALGIETVRVQGREIYVNPESAAARVGRIFAEWELEA